MRTTRSFVAGIVLLILAMLAAVAPIGQAASDEQDFQYEQKQPDQCVAGYNVVLDPNEHQRLVSEGLPEVETQEEAREVVDQLMEEPVKKDPRNLAIYHNATPTGRKEPVDYKELVDPESGNGCFSDFGRDIYQRTLQSYSDASVEPATVPDYGVNTGAYSNGDPFQTAPGRISGDRRGIAVTFRNGDKIHILKRCGNIVTPVPIPKIPPERPPPEETPPPRDTPPPTKPPKSPPPKTPPPSTPPPTPKKCPPGQFFDGKKCGTPTGGPDQNDRTDPGRHPDYAYEPGGGSAEDTWQAHDNPPQDPYEPDPTYGSRPPPGQTSPPGRDADTGETRPGGGVSNTPAPPPNEQDAGPDDPCGGNPANC